MELENWALTSMVRPRYMHIKAAQSSVSIVKARE